MLCFSTALAAGNLPKRRSIVVADFGLVDPILQNRIMSSSPMLLSANRLDDFLFDLRLDLVAGFQLFRFCLSRRAVFLLAELELSLDDDSELEELKSSEPPGLLFSMRGESSTSVRL